MNRAAMALALATVFGAACEDRSHRDMGDEINIVIRRNDALVPPAIARLAAYGRAAIPQIETALHTAAPPGRLHLIKTIETIGDAEGIPVLLHFAVYDVRADVRTACEALLGSWAAAGGPRGDKARAALARIAQKRAAGEAPLVFGDGGAPGMPSTVGAIAPVGIGLETK